MTHTLAATAQPGEAVTFWLLAIVSVAAALAMVFLRRAVHSAMMLAVVMLSLAVLYAVQDAPFLAFVQVIVYTGAVLMLFLFVLMLVGVSSTDSLIETIRGQRAAAAIAAVGFMALLGFGLGNTFWDDAVGLAQANAAGNVIGLARLIFTKYVFAFEATSALLITAALGAMVLAHRERTTPKPTQKELSRLRFQAGHHVTPLPGPGTYARHNAVDMPARLPDGTPSELSVSPIIVRRPGLQPDLEVRQVATVQRAPADRSATAGDVMDDAAADPSATDNVTADPSTADPSAVDPATPPIAPPATPGDAAEPGAPGTPDAAGEEK